MYVARALTPQPLVHRVCMQATSNGQPFCSFEFFPPKTAAGVENLYATHHTREAVAPCAPGRCLDVDADVWLC
jgi:hypothetical protein